MQCDVKCVRSPGQVPVQAPGQQETSPGAAGGPRLAGWQIGRLAGWCPGASVACSPSFTECKPEVCRTHEGSEAGTGPGWGCELTDIACSGRTAARNANGRPHACASGSSAVSRRKKSRAEADWASTFFLL